MDAAVQGLAGAGRCIACTCSNPQLGNHTAAVWAPVWLLEYSLLKEVQRNQ